MQGDASYETYLTLSYIFLNTTIATFLIINCVLMSDKFQREIEAYVERVAFAVADNPLDSFEKVWCVLTKIHSPVIGSVHLKFQNQKE